MSSYNGEKNRGQRRDNVAAPAETIASNGQKVRKVKVGDGWAYEPIAATPAPISTGGLRAAIQPQRMAEVQSSPQVSLMDELDQKKRALVALQEMATPLQRQIEDLEKARAEEEKAEAERINQAALLDYLSTRNGVQTYPVMPSSAPRVQPSFEAHDTVSDIQDVAEEPLNEKPTKNKMPRGRRLGVIAIVAVGALGAAGAAGVATNTIKLGSADASIASDEKPHVAVDPATIPDLAPATLIDAFGGCLDERGAGPALYSGKFDATVTSSWKYKDPTGAEYPLAAKTQAGDYFKPTTALTETPVRYTACVEAGNRESVIKIEGDTVTVDYAKISPQIYVDVNKKLQSLPGIKDGFNGTVDLFVSGKGMTPEEGARLKAAYADGPNKDAELAQARMRMAEVLSDEAGAYAQQASVNTELKIEAAIKKEVEDLYNKGLSKYKEVKVNGIGKIDDPQAKDPMIIKNPAPANSNAFTLDKDSTKILKFSVNTDGSTEAVK
jgi:hypothetical protein